MIPLIVTTYEGRPDPLPFTGCMSASIQCGLRADSVRILSIIREAGYYDILLHTFCESEGGSEEIIGRKKLPVKNVPYKKIVKDAINALPDKDDSLLTVAILDSREEDVKEFEDILQVMPYDLLIEATKSASC